MYKILVIEDEENIASFIKMELTYEGYEVENCYDGKEGLDKALSQDYHLVLLDLMLPTLNGIEICRRIRKFKTTPIIMLTARDSVMDKVSGFQMGADDYVTKPFSNRELVARVKANLRRRDLTQKATEDDEDKNITIGNLVIMPEAYMVEKNGEKIELTHREFELLHYLAQHMGQVMTSEHLLQTVWGYDYFGDVRTVDVTVRRLREKIEDNPSSPTILVTRRGVGYYVKNPSDE